MSCSPAQLAYAKKYRDAHKGEAATYRDLHKEDARAYMAAYYENHKAADAARYQRNREKMLAQHAAYKADNRDALAVKYRQDAAEFIEWLQILRTNNGCKDCETHEGRLVHHHVDPSTKLYNVSQMHRHAQKTFHEE